MSIFAGTPVHAVAKDHGCAENEGERQPICSYSGWVEYALVDYNVQGCQWPQNQGEQDSAHVEPFQISVISFFLRAFLFKVVGYHNFV